MFAGCFFVCCFASSAFHFRVLPVAVPGGALVAFLALGRFNRCQLCWCYGSWLQPVLLFLAFGSLGCATSPTTARQLTGPCVFQFLYHFCMTVQTEQPCGLSEISRVSSLFRHFPCFIYRGLDNYQYIYIYIYIYLFFFLGGGGGGGPFYNYSRMNPRTLF